MISIQLLPPWPSAPCHPWGKRQLFWVLPAWLPPLPKGCGNGALETCLPRFWFLENQPKVRLYEWILLRSLLTNKQSVVKLKSSSTRPSSIPFSQLWSNNGKTGRQASESSSLFAAWEVGLWNHEKCTVFVAMFYMFCTARGSISAELQVTCCVLCSFSFSF